MEMLPELGQISETRLLNWIGSEGEVVDNFQLRKETCSLLRSQLRTETEVANLSIICIEVAFWRQILYKWCKSHINNVIAGLIEKLIGSGTSDILEVETLTEPTVAADAELTPGLVEDVGEEPMLTNITKPGLELQSLHHVGGQGEGLYTEHGEVTGRVSASRGGLATRALEVIRGRVEVDTSGRAPSTSGERLSQGQHLEGASLWMNSRYREQGKMASVTSVTFVEFTASPLSRSGPLRPQRRPRAVWKTSLIVDMTRVQKPAPNARARPGLTSLQTENVHSHSHSESRNLSPDHRHRGQVISNPVSRYNPAGPDWGLGTRHGAVLSSSVVKLPPWRRPEPPNLTWSRYQTTVNSEHIMNQRTRLSSSTKALEGK